MSGVVQNQDSYMKGKIAQRKFYDRVLPTLKAVMDEYGRLTGRKYDVVMPYRLDDADYAIVGSGCMMETAEAAVDYIREQHGHQGRPAAHHVLPAVSRRSKSSKRCGMCKAIAVLERLDIPMMQSNPQLCEIKAAFADAMSGTPGYPELDAHAEVLRRLGRTGQPRCSRRRLHRRRREHAQREPARTTSRWASSTRLALPVTNDPDVRAPGSFSMRGHSVGGYGSVTTNKVIATIAGEVFGMDVQAYPKYGSEKKGLPTTYYLTIAKEHIRVHSELEHVEFIPLNDVNAFNLENPLAGLSRERHGVRSEPEDGSGRSLGRHSRLGAEGTGREERAAVRAGYGADRQGSFLAGRSAAAHAGHRAAGRLPAGHAVPVRARGISEEVLFQGVEKSLRKYFGKRGERSCRTT